MFGLIPKEEKFFEMFETQAAHNVEAAKVYKDLAQKYNRDGGAFDKLRDIEHEADITCHEIYDKLNRTFVTPFDREDIHTLAEWLDDVVDDIHGAADLMQLHRVEHPLPELGDLADLLVDAADANTGLIGRLSSLKDMDPLLERIGKLESEADAVYRRCVARLFSGEFKAFEVLRSKDVVEAVEHAVNAIEKVSDGVESILLKHA